MCVPQTVGSTQEVKEYYGSEEMTQDICLVEMCSAINQLKQLSKDQVSVDHLNQIESLINRYGLNLQRSEIV